MRVKILNFGRYVNRYCRYPYRKLTREAFSSVLLAFRSVDLAASNHGDSTNEKGRRDWPDALLQRVLSREI